MFSLIDEPWIVGATEDGEIHTVGLKDIFDGSAPLVRLQGESLLQDYSVLRLLLAVYWRAHQQQYSGGTEMRDGELSTSFALWFSTQMDKIQGDGRDPLVVEYLENYRERFELFDANLPFMQVADLRTKKNEFKPVVDLVPEAQNEYFSMRAGVEKETLDYAEAARWLVYFQAFDVSGIKAGVEGDSRTKGGKSYPVGTGWAGYTGGTLVQGKTVLETLLLNTAEEAITNPQDRPIWERPQDGPDVRDLAPGTGYGAPASNSPQGPADLATWQGRRVRLIPDNGAVRSILATNGDKIPDAGANVFGDTMTPYRYSTNKSKKGNDVYYPQPYAPEQTLWKSIVPLISAIGDSGFSGKEKAPLRPRVLDTLSQLSEEIDGIPAVLNIQQVSVEYGPQAAIIRSTIQAELGLPTALLLENNMKLRVAVRQAVQQAQDAAIAFGAYVGQLAVAAGGDYQFSAGAKDELLSLLEPVFTPWLRDLPVEFDVDSPEFLDAQRQWQLSVRKHTEQLARVELRGAGPRAFSGRQVFNGPDDTRGRLISAGSVYGALAKKLNEILPATAPEKEKK